jgi:acyl-CoA reductase-like NAD-dependent aldehyde dehydrogenase
MTLTPTLSGELLIDGDRITEASGGTHTHIPQGAYGGYKQSGFGRTGGLERLHEFLQVKNIRIGVR